MCLSVMYFNICLNYTRSESEREEFDVEENSEDQQLEYLSYLNYQKLCDAENPLGICVRNKKGLIL